ncbi:MAG TPA: YerC/YecD family TrpR-related protein [Candidatus Dormibacteraeota bacterium]|nr:YerC/YecD family TrpR-related protein [Candidatus Dormibacteraeota bacterium]
MIKGSSTAPKPSRPTSDAAPELFTAISELGSAEEAEEFLRDLCTIQELQSLSARWQVARLLDQGMHYHDIVELTGASTATISRVNTWLRFGTGGYRRMLQRSHERPS